MEQFYMNNYVSGTPVICWILSNNTQTKVKIENIGKFKKEYVTNKNHLDFFKMLPFIIDHFEDLETAMKDYYNYSLETSYQFQIARQKITEISNFLLKMHPFFESDIIRFNYIIDNLLSYCKRMTDKRFFDHLYKNCPRFKSIPDPEIDEHGRQKITEEENRLISDIEEQIPQFYQYEEETLSEHLFLPIYEILTQDEISKEELSQKCSYVWRKYMTAKLPDASIRYLLESYQTLIMKIADSQNVLSALKNLSVLISDYIYAAKEAFAAHPNLSMSQMYAIFLTNHHVLNNILNTDTLYIHPHYDVVFDLCQYTIQEQRRKQSLPILVFPDDIYCPTATDSLYAKIKDFCNTDTNGQKVLIEEIEKYYPHDKIASFMESQIINISFFEQIIAIEFLDILKENYTIRKCGCPGCESYFKTNDKRIRYCKRHKNIPASYRKKNTESQFANSQDIGKIYKKYYNRFKKRISRNKDILNDSQFEKWNSEAKKLTQKYDSLREPQIELYTNELDALSKAYGFLPFTRNHH